MRTARNLARHEFIGLSCRVRECSNPSSVGISGIVRDETMKTLVVEKKRVQKQGSSFEFLVEGKPVVISGGTIALRPEDRIKMKLIKW